MLRANRVLPDCPTPVKQSRPSGWDQGAAGDDAYRTEHREHTALSQFRQARRRRDLIARCAEIPLDRDHLELRFAVLLALAEARA